MVWDSSFFKNFPKFVVIHIVKGFGRVNKEKVDFFWNSCFFYVPTDVGNLISCFAALEIQLEYLEILGSGTVEAWLGEF